MYFLLLRGIIFGMFLNIQMNTIEMIKLCCHEKKTFFLFFMRQIEINRPNRPVLFHRVYLKYFEQQQWPYHLGFEL